MSGRGWVALALGLLPACSVPLGQAFSLDHRHRAQVVATIFGLQIERDGRTVARRAAVDVDSLRLSESGRRLAYAVREGRASRVVVDGAAEARPQRWDAVLAGSLRLGDRGPVLYVAQRAGALFVVRGDRAAGPYDGVSALQADAAGAHVAYVARRGAAAWAVVDDRAQGPYEALAELSLSPRGGRAAVLVRRDHRWWVLCDGLAEPHESAAGLRFNDGGRLFYVARDRGRERVVEAGRPPGGRDFARIEWQTLRFDEQGEPVYVAQEDGQRFVVRGGEAGPPYEGVRGLGVWGRRLAYVGRRGGREQAVIDGSGGPWFDEVGDVVLAPSGAGHGYLARRGTALRLVSGARELPLSWALAGSLALCPGGSPGGLLGGLAPGAHQVLIDGRPLRHFDPDDADAVLRTWGPRGLRRWVEAELGPACAPQGADGTSSSARRP